MMKNNDKLAREEIIGQFSLSLSSLYDQTKKSEWFNLYDKFGEITNNQILLELQWIYSKVKKKKN